jgi:hypothetical protein
VAKAIVAALAGVLVGGLGCSDPSEPLDPTPSQIECAEAIDRADDIYATTFSMLDNPSCSVDADCVVIPAQLQCEGFEHRQRPFAVHASEREVALDALSERLTLCGRSPPTCRLQRDCYEDVSALRALCSEAGTCTLAADGQCL